MYVQSNLEKRIVDGVIVGTIVDSYEKPKL